MVLPVSRSIVFDPTRFNPGFQETDRAGSTLPSQKNHSTARLASGILTRLGLPQVVNNSSYLSQRAGISTVAFRHAENCQTSFLKFSTRGIDNRSNPSQAELSLPARNDRLQVTLHRPRSRPSILAANWDTALIDRLEGCPFLPLLQETIPFDSARVVAVEWSRCPIRESSSCPRSARV
jgi:hypothetical protein